MKIEVFKAEFILSAPAYEILPAPTLPEIAFAGRSNVGKSSLINSIALRKNLAHTSAAPGKTRALNFFNIEQRWILVDMPGFGYATIGKQYREKWEKMNYEYLAKRTNLKLVCVLIDSRHDPMEHDLALIEFLENSNKSYLIILTKCDKLSKKLIGERENQIREFVSKCNYNIDVLPYSSKENLGRNELIGIIKRVTS